MTSSYSEWLWRNDWTNYKNTVGLAGCWEERKGAQQARVSKDREPSILQEQWANHSPQRQTAQEMLKVHKCISLRELDTKQVSRGLMRKQNVTTNCVLSLFLGRLPSLTFTLPCVWMFAKMAEFMYFDSSEISTDCKSHFLLENWQGQWSGR